MPTSQSPFRQPRRFAARVLVGVDLPTAQLGRTDMRITRVGLGVTAPGGRGWAGGPEPPDEAEIRRRRADVLKRGLPYFVAERGGEVVGFAYAAPYRTRPAYRFTVEDSVYVHSDHLGHGVGATLLAVLIAACERAGYRQMIAVIGDSANQASIKLHERCGFALDGQRPATGFKFGRWVDSVLMQRALGKGEGTPPLEQERPGSRS